MTFYAHGKERFVGVEPKFLPANLIYDVLNRIATNLPAR